MLVYHPLDCTIRKTIFLSNEEYEAFINLKNNKNSVIQKADKDKRIVIIDRMSKIVKVE